MEEKKDKLRVVLDWQVPRRKKRHGAGGMLKVFFWLLMAAILVGCALGFFGEFLPAFKFK